MGKTKKELEAELKMEKERHAEELEKARLCREIEALKKERNEAKYGKLKKGFEKIGKATVEGGKSLGKGLGGALSSMQSFANSQKSTKGKKKKSNGGGNGLKFPKIKW